MGYDPGAMEAALAAAVGSETSLLDELRDAFFVSADAHMATLATATTVTDWTTAAARLKSLAASFGALRVLDAAQLAQGAPIGDRRALQRLSRALAAIRTAADD